MNQTIQDGRGNRQEKAEREITYRNATRLFEICGDRLKQLRGLRGRQCPRVGVEVYDAVAPRRSELRGSRFRFDGVSTAGQTRNKSVRRNKHADGEIEGT